MGTSFRVELEELEQARATLEGLLQDLFTDVSSPLHPVTFQNNTASSIDQSQVSGQLRHVEMINGAQSSSNFGPMDQGVDAVSQLDTAHGQAHAAILSLINDINTKINTLSERAAKTHQIYSTTEDDLQVHVDAVQNY